MWRLQLLIFYIHLYMICKCWTFHRFCNCRNKNNCLLYGKCLTPNIYEAQITWNQLNFKQKIYIAAAETDLKHRFNNHTKSFNLEHYENETGLSTKYWTTKPNHFTPKATWRIIRKRAPINTTKRKYYLCLNQKLEIPSYKGDNLLNKRSEIINKWRHQTNFTILRHDSKDYELCFHCDISHCIPNGDHVLAFAVYVLHIWFWEQKSSSSKRQLHCIILRGIFPVNRTRTWRQFFVWILLNCNFFARRYIFWLNFAIRHENLCIKT